MYGERPSYSYSNRSPLYFGVNPFYAWRVNSFFLSASYYYGFFGYNRWRPGSSVR
jgi:hypothetical protein